LRNLRRIAVQLLRSSEVKVRLVNRNLLNERTPRIKERHHLIRGFAVSIVSRFNEDQLRATRARNMCGERRAYTERARLIVCGADHAALSVAVANCNRLSGERRIVADLYRRKEGVKVNVKDAARCGRVRCRQPFLLSATQLASSSVQP
jgi:hypothetical protein